MTTMGPRTPQEMLRESVRRNTDPRWQLPVVQMTELPDPEKRTQRVRLWLVAIGAVALAAIVFGVAKAAERRGKYEITLLYAGKDYDSVTRTFRTLGGEPFDTKADCDVAITRVRVLVAGARLRCDPVQLGRVN